MNSWISQLSNDTKLSVLWTKFDFHIQVDLFMELPSKNNFCNNLLFSHHTDIICSFVCFGTSFSGMIKGGTCGNGGTKKISGGQGMNHGWCHGCKMKNVQVLRLFFCWQQLFTCPLYVCMKQIFLTKEDIPLYIRFLKPVYSEEKITSVCC